MTVNLIIMCGLPFAGKTTLARSLAETVQGKYISLDDTITELGFWDQGYDITQQQWNEAYATAYQYVREALVSSASVIYDETNYARLHRDRLRTIAHGAGAQSYVVYIKIPSSEVHQRIKVNRLQPQRGDITDAALAYVAKRLDVPTRDENTIIVTPEMFITTAIDHIQCALIQNIL